MREVYAELRRAEKQHGPQYDVPLGCSAQYTAAADYAKGATRRAFEGGTLTWVHIAHEEVLECFAEEDLDKIRAEAIQAAAMFAKIALVCDYQMERDNPLTASQRVTSPDFGRGTVEILEPDNEKLGPTAWIRWDNGRGLRAYDLDWARKLERIA